MSNAGGPAAFQSRRFAQDDLNYPHVARTPVDRRFHGEAAHAPSRQPRRQNLPLPARASDYPAAMASSVARKVPPPSTQRAQAAQGVVEGPKGASPLRGNE